MAQNPFLESPLETATDRIQQERFELPPLPQEEAAAPAQQPAAAPSQPKAKKSGDDNYAPPPDLRPLFESAARKYNVPVNVLMALGHQESRFNPSAIGVPTQWGRAKGMMQYLDDTASRLGINPFEPTEAVSAAARQIRERLDKGYSMEDAVKAHFAGDNRKLWKDKTAAYGREVLAKAARIGETLYPFDQSPEEVARRDRQRTEIQAQEAERTRMQQPASAGLPQQAPRERTWGEVASDTGVQLAEGANNIIGAVPNLVSPQGEVAAFFNRNAQYWSGQQSEPLKQKIDAANAKISEAGKDGILSQMTEAASTYFSDPGLAARFITTNLPSMIPGIAAAKVAQAAAVARGATAAKAAAAATTAAGGANAVLNAGGARGEAFNDIKQTLMQQGMAEDKAIEQALKDSRIVAAVGAVTGYLSGKTGLESALVGKQGASGAVRAGIGATAAELAGEQAEEVLPKLTTNYQAGQYDKRSLGKDVGRTIVETAIGSGPGAMVSGGAAALNARGQQPAAQPAPGQAPQFDMPPEGSAFADAGAQSNPVQQRAPTVEGDGIPAGDYLPTLVAEESKPAGPMTRALENTAIQQQHNTAATTGPLTKALENTAEQRAPHTYSGITASEQNQQVENEPSGAIELGTPIAVKWKSGKFEFSETRTYERMEDDGRISRTTVDEDGNTKKEWLIVKEDGTEIWAERAGNKDDYASVTPEQAQNIANEDMPNGAQVAPAQRSATPNISEQAADVPSAQPETAPAKADASQKPEEEPKVEAPKAEAKPEPRIDDMDEPQLRAMLKDITTQAKTEGWTPKLKDQRRAVERTINQLVTADFTAAIDAAPADLNELEAKVYADLTAAMNAQFGEDVAAELIERAAVMTDGQSAEQFFLALEGLTNDRQQQTAESIPAGQEPIASQPAEGSAGAAQQGQKGQAEEVAPAKDEHAGKWFGSAEKAAAYIAKKKAGATHDAVQTGKARWEIKPKATVKESLTADAAKDVPNLAPAGKQQPTSRVVRVYTTQSGKVGATVKEQTGADGRVTYAYTGEWGAGSGKQLADMEVIEQLWHQQKRGFTVADSNGNVIMRGKEEPTAPAAKSEATVTGDGVSLEDSGAIELARNWDRSNRTGRSVEWQAGAAESNPAFNAVGADGARVPAHGMAKAATLGEGLKNLVSLLNGGIDPNRTLYYDALTNPSGVYDGATAGGHAYRDGPFIITFREGLNGRQPTSRDITGVLVNPAHSELVDPLQRMFPNLVVRDYHNSADVVAASLNGKPQAEAKQAVTVIDNRDTNAGEYIVRVDGRTNLARFEIGRNGKPVRVKYFHDAQATRNIVDQAMADFLKERNAEIESLFGSEQNEPAEPATPAVEEVQAEDRQPDAFEAAKYLKDFVYSLGSLEGMTDRAQVALSSDLGKSGRDTLLMQAFGITRGQAHDINNSLDSRKPSKLRNEDMQEAFDLFPGLRKIVDDAVKQSAWREDKEGAAPVAKFIHDGFGFLTKAEAEKLHEEYLEIARQSRQMGKDASTDFLKKQAKSAEMSAISNAKNLRKSIAYNSEAHSEYTAQASTAAEEVKASATQKSPQRFEYPESVKGDPEWLAPSQNAVVDFMNGEISKPALLQRFADLGLTEGQVRSVTNRIDLSYGEIESVAKLREEGKEVANLPATRSGTKAAEVVDAPVENPDELIKAIADAVRGDAQVRFVKDKDTGRFNLSIKGLFIGTMDKQPAKAEEALAVAARRYMDALAAAGRTMPQDPRQMTRDQFVAVNGLAGLVQDFEVTGPIDAEGSGVKVGDNGLFYTDHDALYDRIQAEAKPTEPATPTGGKKGQFANNKIFTADKVEAARARLKSKLNQLNSGIDPELLVDGMTIAGAYIEDGVRNFRDYAKAMTDDFGDSIKPYLLSFYEAARNYPGLDTEGMTPVGAAKVMHSELMKDADTSQVKEAIGETVEKPAKRTRKTGAKSDMTLTQDWGVDHIDGYGDSYDRETGNDVKDAFLKEARAYLTAVAGVLTEQGYAPHTDSKGRPEKPVSVNESGVAGSGDVSLTLVNPVTGNGIYVHISDTSLRGVVPTTPSGIAIMFRSASAGDKLGIKGQNRWAPVDLSAADFAILLDKEAKSRAAKPAIAPTQAAAKITEEVKQNDTQGNQAGADDRAQEPAAGAVRATESQQPAGRGAEPDRGQSRAVDSGSAPAGNRGGNDAGQAGVRARPATENADAEQPVQGRGERSPAAGRRGAGEPASSVANYRIQPGELKREGSWRATAERNIGIVELVKKITAEGRQATPEERAQLAKFTGWGASEIANGVFPDKYGRYKDETWRKLGERLQAALTPEEYAQARRTTQYAHYTSESVIRSIYDGLQRLGVAGGTLLEPGMGIGHFNGLMPDGMAANTRYTGIEYDTITGNIAKLLYPASNVIVGDYTRTNLPKDFFDAAIGNPPFSSTQVLTDPEYKSRRPMLHDYFFMKTIDRVKPGGVLVFVTSKGTMDKASDKSRKYLAERANLLGAVRLPQTAFKDNAGTEVVTDVIFLQKRGPGIADNGMQWLGTKEVQTPQGPTAINEYFADHPDMVLGKHALTGSMYRKDEYTVLPPDGDIEQLFAKALQALPENVSRPVQGSLAERALVQDRDFNPKHKKEGGLYLSDDGKLMQVDNGSGVEVAFRSNAEGKQIALTPKQKKWLRDYVGLRDALKQAQYDQLNDGNWEKSLKALNKAYDGFVKEHGHILEYTTIERTAADGTVTETKRYKNEPLLRIDAEGALAYALENVKEDGTIIKGAVLNSRVLETPREPEIKTTQDALFVSLNRNGALVLDDVATLAGTDKETVIRDLGTAIYDAPGEGWKLADDYLSGNVVRKLKEARAAAEVDPRYKRNVEALLAAQPRPLGPTDITVRLGANWVPASDIEKFGKEVLGEDMDITYNPLLNKWDVEQKTSSLTEWGFDKMTAGQIIDAVLNNRQLKVTYRDQDNKTHVDLEATEKANDISRKMRERFSTWLWTDAKRAERLVAYYNENFNNIAQRQFDGSHLTLPGVSARLKLYPHQKRAVWRVIQQGDTYLAHAVGAGKTMEMIAAGMEERRLGLVNKPMYVVPNHMLAQFSREFLELYPAANIMVADEHNFQTHNRKRFVAQAALNNPDAIVITHSAFGRIGMSDEYYTDFIQRQIDDWKEALEETDDRITVKQIERRIEQLEQRMEGRQNRDKKDQVLSFEELGVDKLYVDEFHEFRKLDFATNQGNVKGIDPNGSQRALDLFMKVEYLRGKKPGRSLVAASGTPVTNTMGELFTSQRFFQPEQMKEDGLENFDAWSSQYGDIVTGFEQNAAGGYEMVARFAKFQNVPELMRRVRSFMDILTSSNLGELVKRPDVENGSRQVEVTPSPEGYKEFQQQLQTRIQAIRNRKGPPKKGEDIILNVIGDGRFSAIDMRFVDPTLPSDPNSKLNVAIDQIISAYKETASWEYSDKDGSKDPLTGSTIILFTDIGLGEQSAASRGFDMRGWIEQRLTEAGIPREHIAFMRDFKQHAKKERMFSDMREGKKRILIGGKEMETGTNVQKRLSHLFHLDAPWFPASVEQREGRAVRQGNQNKQVVLKAFATKGSYDSTMWGMNARKARFIEQAMNGDDSVRSMDDVSEASAFEMAAALASGDERYMKLAGLKADVDRLDRLRYAHYEDQNRLMREKHWADEQIKRNTARAKDLAAAIAKRKPIRAGEFEAKVGKATYDNREEFSQAVFKEFQRLAADNTMDEVAIGEIGGFSIRFYGTELKGGNYAASLHVELPGDPAPLLVFPLDPEMAVSGIATRAANQVNGLDKELAEAQRYIDTGKAKVEQADKRLGAPFPEEALLLDKVAELNNLETELAAESKQAAAEAAAATAEVEGAAEQQLDGAMFNPLRNVDGTYRRQDPIRYSANAKGKAGGDVARVMEELRNGPSGEVIARLIDAGQIVLHQSADTLPGAARGKRGVQAVTLANGEIHLVADSLEAGSAMPVLLHEMFHKGGQALVGSKEWGNLMGRLGSLKRQASSSAGKMNEFFQRANDRVEAARQQGAVSTGMTEEEFGAYAIEEWEQQRDSLPAVIRKWVDDVIGQVKAYVLRRFGKQLGAVTPAQLAAIAKMVIANSDFNPVNPDTRYSVKPEQPNSPRSKRNREAVEKNQDAYADAKAAQGAEFNRFAGIVDQAGRNVVKGINALRTTWGLVSDNQKAIPAIRDAYDLEGKMDGRRIGIATEASKAFGRDFSEMAIKDPATADKLADLMTQATLWQIKPDKPKNDRWRSEWQAKYDELRAMWDALPQEAKDLYDATQKFYEARSKDIHNALKERIMALEIGEKQKRDMLAELQERFDRELGTGPYFPLARFGSYLVIGVKGEGDNAQRVVMNAEYAPEAKAMAAELRNRGYEVTTKMAKEQAQEQDMRQSSELVRKIAEMIEMQVPDFVAGPMLDELNQIFLDALPLASARKSFIHRKNVAGFSRDMARALNQSAVKLAGQVAKLEYAQKIEEAFVKAEKQAEASPDNFDLQPVVAEMRRRFESTMRFKTNPVAAALQQAGFAFTLAYNLSSAAVNLLQMAIAGGHMGARHGAMKANAQIAKALREIATTAKQRDKNAHIFDLRKTGSQLSAGEKKMLEALEQSGKIDVTAAMDAYRAAHEDTKRIAESKVGRVMQKVMDGMGVFMQAAEVVNRQAVALAAYRMELQKTDGDVDAAIKYAAEVLDDTQFNMNISNQPRFMHNNAVRVVMQYKGFAINMMDYLGRTMRTAMDGMDKGERRQATKALGLVFGMQVALAGIGSLPLYMGAAAAGAKAGKMAATAAGGGAGAKRLASVLGGGVGALALAAFLNGAFGDDDEPWDWKADMRRWLAENTNATLAQLLDRGLFSIAGVDIADRISMNGLMMRDLQEQHGKKAWQNMAEEAALGMGGVALSKFYLGGARALDALEQGNTKDAFISMLPLALANVLKGADMAANGVTDKRTGAKLMDVNAGEAMVQMFGFQPSDVRERRWADNVAYNADKQMQDRKSRLLEGIAKAVMADDSKAEDAAWQAADRWNEKNGDLYNPITQRDVNNRVRQMEDQRSMMEGDGRTKGQRQQLERQSVYKRGLGGQ